MAPAALEAHTRKSEDAVAYLSTWTGSSESDMVFLKWVAGGANNHSPTFPHSLHTQPMKTWTKPLQRHWFLKETGTWDWGIWSLVGWLHSMPLEALSSTSNETHITHTHARAHTLTRSHTSACSSCYVARGTRTLSVFYKRLGWQLQLCREVGGKAARETGLVREKKKKKNRLRGRDTPSPLRTLGKFYLPDLPCTRGFLS